MRKTIPLFNPEFEEYGDAREVDGEVSKMLEFETNSEIHPVTPLCPHCNHIMAYAVHGGRLVFDEENPASAYIDLFCPNDNCSGGFSGIRLRLQVKWFESATAAWNDSHHCVELSFEEGDE